MFQIAAAIGYAKRFGYQWRGEPVNHEVPRWYDFFPHIPKGGLTGQPHCAHDGKDFNFKSIPNYGTCQLHGFFQSLKYFEHCQDEVREVFKLPVTEDMQECCSIHVRRGDYVEYAADFPPVTENYIKQAIFQMRERGVKKFMFFSDGMNWCRAKFPNLEYSEGRNEYEDLALMASCGNHIIANSTFSWWGAYLGVNPDRHIISPSHKSWFGSKNGVVKALGAPKDIIPNGWQQIDF